MASNAKVQCLVNYYLREGLTHSVLDVTSILLKRSPADVNLQFWKAFALNATGNASQATPLLRSLKNNEAVAPACTATLLAAAKAGAISDSEFALADDLDTERSTAAPEACLLLAAAQWHLREFQAALLTLDSIEAAGAAPEVAHAAGTVQGWVLLAQYAAAREDEDDDDEDDDGGVDADAGDLGEAETLFRDVLDADAANIEALQGLARVRELQNDAGGALELINRLHIKHGWFAPAVMEKCKLSLAVHGWPEVMECVSMLQQLDANNVMAFAYKTLYVMLEDGNNAAAALHLKDLVGSIQATQPRNASLMVRLAAPIARLACGDTAILTLTRQLVESARTITAAGGGSGNIALAHAISAPRISVELARQHLLCGDIAAATRLLTAERDVGVANMVGLLTAEAEAMSGNAAAAASTHELYAGSLETQDERAYSAYVAALIAAVEGADFAAALRLVEAALQAQLDALQGAQKSLAFYAKLDPSRPVALVRVLLERAAAEGDAGAPTSGGGAGGGQSAAVSRCMAILASLARHMPKLHALSLLQARGQFIAGDHDASLRRLLDIVRTKPGDIEARLMQASIYMSKDRPEAAAGALQAALAGNFGVKAWPLYHVLKGRIAIARSQKASSEENRKAALEEARGVLAAACAMPGVQNDLTPDQRMAPHIRLPTQQERAQTLCMHALVLHKLWDGESKEAQDLMRQAERLFQGTAAEVTVLTTTCELALHKQDVGSAIKKLRAIKARTPQYRAARLAIADVSLRYLKDRRAFAAAHLDVVNTFGDYEAHVTCGDAFLRIQEPEKALEMYKAALERGNRTAQIFCKLGRCYSAMHLYTEAVGEFAKAMRLAPDDAALRLELVDLFTRIRNIPRAQEEMQTCEDYVQSMDADSVERLSLQVKLHQRRARLATVTHDANGALPHLSAAFEAQKNLLAALRGEFEDLLEDARRKAVEIGAGIADDHIASRRFAAGREMLQAMLAVAPDDPATVLKIARLDMMEGKGPECQQRCQEAVRLCPDPQHELHVEAVLLLARMLASTGQYEGAVSRLLTLLEARPGLTGARVALLDCYRRSGKMDAIEAHMAAAEQALPKASENAGFQFCRAQVARYKHESNEALAHAALARRDPHVLPRATYLMVEIYLAPLVAALWGGELIDAHAAASACSNCQQLLLAMPGTERASIRWQVWFHYMGIVSPAPNAADAAMTELLRLGQQDSSNVPVLLAIATGFVKLQQIPKARTQLKRIQKLSYNPEDAEDFEQAWLLLAKIHVDGGKLDLAADMCDRCLKYNASAARGWELRGIVAEQQSDWAAAAKAYQQAWRLTKCSNPAVGYRLAWNHMRCVRFVDAINVALEVLEKFPDYPKIGCDIVEPCLAKVRSKSERDEKQQLGLLQVA